MSAMFNNTASQREAAFIKAVRQGFFFQQHLQQQWTREHPTLHMSDCRSYSWIFSYASKHHCAAWPSLYGERRNKKKKCNKRRDAQWHSSDFQNNRSLLKRWFLENHPESRQSWIHAPQCSSEAARCHGSSPAQGGIHFDSCCSYSCSLNTARLQDFWTGKPSVTSRNELKGVTET